MAWKRPRFIEIIDHHRIGSIETMGPVFFRNQPLGCTANDHLSNVPRVRCGTHREDCRVIVLRILSDTLIYRSPTCTDTDREAAEALAEIAGIDTEQYAAEMFAAGSKLSSKSPEEIFYQDFKKFVANDLVFGVGQITSMDRQELVAIKDKLLPYMERRLPTMRWRCCSLC